MYPCLQVLSALDNCAANTTHGYRPITTNLSQIPAYNLVRRMRVSSPEDPLVNLQKRMISMIYKFMSKVLKT